MPLLDDDDLALLLDPAEFGTQAVYNGQPVNVRFDNGWAATEMVEGSAPKFVGRAVDFPGISQGAAITINAVGFTVNDVRPNGRGLIVVSLFS